jgi:hypothetical protein
MGSGIRKETHPGSRIQGSNKHRIPEPSLYEPFVGKNKDLPRIHRQSTVTAHRTLLEKTKTYHESTASRL